MDYRNRSTRRRWLAVCGGTAAGIAGLAGCTSSEETPSGEESTSGLEVGDGSWPMAHYDAANTAVTSNSGPESKPEEEWTMEFDSSPSVPVAANGSVFVTERRGLCHKISIDSGQIEWTHEPDDWGYIRDDPNIALTPAIVGETVYVPGSGIEALDFEGNTIWKSDHDPLFDLRVHNGCIYGRTEDVIYGVSISSEDDTLHIESTSGSEIHTIAITDDKVFAKTREGDEDFTLEAYRSVS